MTFWPVLQCEFNVYDDPGYITSNPHLAAGLTADSLWWGITTFYFANWHPLV